MNQWMQLRRLRGPAYLVLLGIMFLLAEWHIIAFHRSWPLLLILAGVLSLAERAALARVDPGQVGAGWPGTYPGYPIQGYTPPAPANASVSQPAPSTPLAGTELATTEPGSSTIDKYQSDQGRS